MACLECGGETESKGNSEVCVKCGEKDALVYTEKKGRREELCTQTKELLQLDPSIRWVGVLDLNGEMQASRIRPGISPLLRDKEFNLRVPIIAGVGAKLGEVGFGAIRYALVKYESAYLGFLMNFKDMYLATFEPSANAGHVLDALRKYLETKSASK